MSLSFQIYEKRKISDADFERLSKFVTSNYGIRLPKEKKVMVEGRLQKRLRAIEVNDFTAYLDHVFGDEGSQEMVQMVDAITTNKTDFFRESAHFEFLSKQLLPGYEARYGKKSLTVWSAAASTGEEIYTLAMVLEEYNRLVDFNKRIDYHILGTDLSTEALKSAVNAVYKFDRIDDVPVELRNRYFLRSKDRQANTVRVKGELRRKVAFRRMNLVGSHHEVQEQFDMIFCRNVLIYFDKETQESVINKLCRRLRPGGFFFLGHSESIIGKDVPLKSVMPTVYQRM